ncbi:hypothetical protein BH18ACT12_BH18ACT12_15650 [soil metagenome]
MTGRTDLGPHETPSKSAERDWPRMDPPNVLWFSGAIAISVGVLALISTIPDSQNGFWVFLAALGFLLGFATAALWLLKLGWWVPGGLAAWLAVATFPGVAIGFLQLIDVWPEDTSFDPFDDFSGYAFGVALATALFGIAAFVYTRFSFILSLVVLSLLLAAQFVVTGFDNPSGDDSATAALVSGALVVIVGVFLDAFGRRRDAFWFHALGWFSVAAGLVFFAVEPSGDADRAWITMLVVGLLLTSHRARCAGRRGRCTASLATTPRSCTTSTTRSTATTGRLPCY